jgi:hypothetical protein
MSVTVAKVPGAACWVSGSAFAGNGGASVEPSLSVAPSVAEDEVAAPELLLGEPALEDDCAADDPLLPLHPASRATGSKQAMKTADVGVRTGGW